MSLEFEELDSPRKKAYRSLGQGIKVFHDDEYAEVEYDYPIDLQPSTCLIQTQYSGRARSWDESRGVLDLERFTWCICASLAVQLDQGPQWIGETLSEISDHAIRLCICLDGIQESESYDEGHLHMAVR